MEPTTVNQDIVLVCALMCIVLGAVVGPVLSAVPVATWIPVGIGVLLHGQWLLMRRAAAAIRDAHEGRRDT